MGLDFIRRAAPTFRRSLDRSAAALRTPSLFAPDTKCLDRSASATVRPEASLTVGERVLVRCSEGRLFLQRDNYRVAEFPNPPSEFVERVAQAAGVAQGEVRVVRSISGTVEVTLCP